MELNSLREMVEFGSDVEFEYCGKQYVILPWTAQGILIAEQHTENEAVYETYDDLLSRHILDGTPFKDVVDKINITFHS